jgi:formate dehydrogenase subunit gamma
MSEMTLPGQSPTGVGDRTVVRARQTEDVLVGDELVRHRLSSRFIHWSVAFFFFAALLTGMPIWSPIFGWMSVFVGGLNVCRWLHPWFGILFALASLVMFVHWFGEMKMDREERKWFGRKSLEYLRFNTSEADVEVGKYNGGQKMFFWLAEVGMIGLLLSGVVMWFPMSFGQGLRELSYLLHDVAFILFFIAIVGHIYLATAAEPGTFGAMVRGTVTKSWAKLHHPRWYRDVTGGRR